MEKELIYGKNPVQEALQANVPINKVFVAQNLKKAVFDLIKVLARRKSIPVREVDRKKLAEIVGHENHQGVVAILTQSQYGTLEDILTTAQQRNENAMIAILDEIQDPHNLGAIIRSAEAFGIHGIIIPKDRSAGLTETVAKTSSGAISHVVVTRVTNLVQTIKELKSQNVWIIGADQNSNQTISKVDFSVPVAIVIGNEGKGIRRLIKEKCDFLVQIPMYGKINSLNASIAAAILFWEMRQQREENG